MSYALPEAPVEPEGRLAYKWKVLISILFGIFMIILDTTVVNVAFQTLRREYGATLNQAQWIISVYVLALGITTPMSGYLADRFGIKRIYIAGLAVFVIGSVLCGLAPTLLMLIIARTLQGIGGGMAQPLGPAMLYRTFPPEEQGTALGFFGIALVVAPALGPILGGLLVDADLWRWIFFINVPIGLLGIFLASRFLREEKPAKKPRLDPMGLITATLGFGAVLYAASNAEAFGWTSTAIVVSFVVGAVSLIAFAIIELYVVEEPLLDLRLFKIRTFANATVLGYVTVLALFGAEFLMPVYLQALRGRTALQTGVILLALAATSAVVTPISGQNLRQDRSARAGGDGLPGPEHQHLAVGANPGDDADQLDRIPAGAAWRRARPDRPDDVHDGTGERATGGIAAWLVARQQHTLRGASRGRRGAGDGAGERPLTNGACRWRTGA